MQPWMQILHVPWRDAQGMAPNCALAAPHADADAAAANAAQVQQMWSKSLLLAGMSAQRLEGLIRPHNFSCPEIPLVKPWAKSDVPLFWCC
jgi:hypothetical protein